jgi:hypothetical protein
MTTKARQQEILQYKIDNLTQLVANFIFYDISSRKVDKLEILKTSAIAAKIIVDAS